jgi:YidC/Oxa1 family membrane protein insertase
LKKKHLLLFGSLIFLIAVLSGCSEINQPITSDSEGIWNTYFVYPLSWLITKMAEVLGNQYGLSIIVVTIFVRLLILPLMIKQIKSTKAMQAIQPEMNKLREKYSSKDAETQQKLQQETMALFQQHGVNPLAGCLPIFVQMPILIAFYHAIMRTTEIANHSFLWFDLGDKDPLFLLPLIAGATTYIQQKISMVGQDNNPTMQMMLYIMPIMIIVFAINFPAALSLYWVIGNLFSIAQTYFIKGPDIKQAKSDKSIARAGGKKK